MVTSQLTLEWVIMMKMISSMAFVPVMLIAGLLLEPGLIGSGVFITALVLELLVIATAFYNDN